ncbi:tetratricopeptide repeat protein [Streptomyces sp. TRM70350]|uniref:tetratricopeptide repeat protein n=1 Tax=Streptomyces sp. TRM70350 TaxID=2856165 RepID=UPI001C4480B5|nr:tetratricopeptide repeat protein [Streptomyces sp. TRM70350]MBV7696391.1 tetratricopeptide repeat protein [Streptomyces sp. TRM70350]
MRPSAASCTPWAGNWRRQEFLGRYLDVVEPSGAVEAYRRSLALNEQAGETRGAALATFVLGCALDVRGDHAEAMVLLRRAQQQLESRAEPDRRMAAGVRAAIGAVHGHLGDTDAAIRELQEAVLVLGSVAKGMVSQGSCARRRGNRFGWLPRRDVGPQVELTMTRG